MTIPTTLDAPPGLCPLLWARCLDAATTVLAWRLALLGEETGEKEAWAAVWRLYMVKASERTTQGVLS